jgi:hypothetical protein
MAYLDDGHSTTISFANDSGTTLEVREKEVTPPGLAAGGENDITTMRNSTWRTKAPKKLITASPASLVVTYDPDAYTNIISELLGVNNLITITFPDSSTLAFWGWLDEFTPGPLTEGEAPTASITIIPSNQNAQQVETAPVIG